MDEALLRGLMGAHSKIPLEALFLETSSIPVHYVVSSRRLMYLHSILQRSPDELVRKVFEAQRADPSPGDFCKLVDEDKDEIGLDISDAEIKTMSKAKFKKIVKAKIRQSAFLYLESLKQQHSKMDGISYTKFERAEYLTSPLLNSESRKLLLALRTRTVNGIKNDFRGMYPDVTCPLQCGEDDTLQHILECVILKSHHTNNMLSYGDMKYQDVFSADVVKQKQATALYRQLLDVRANLLDSSPVAATGPLHC